MPARKKKLKYKFPDGFLWGTATSSHQIEGNNENNWTEWERQPGNIADGARSGRCCNSWELYKEDIKLAKELNSTCYRFSLEWSRIEPEQGRFDETALTRYRDMARECRRNGIEPIVTLYHWTQPLWFARAGGWLNRQSPLWFKHYAERVAKSLGRDVTIWCTINEPLVYAYNSYVKGKWPAYAEAPADKPHSVGEQTRGKPAVTSVLTRFGEFRRVLRRLQEAHKLAYFVLHDAGNDCQVGIAKHNQFFEPYLDNWFNRMVVALAGRFWNHSFLNGIRDVMDYVGLNYYFHNLVYVSLKGYVLMNENKQTSDMGWEIYPKGIYEVLMDLKRYDLPVYILENGLADARDDRRADFIREHLRYVHQATQDGADVRGYCHWSLLDNFEWAEGFEPKFGLYKVNLKTFERTPRKSAAVYAEIAKNNGF